MNSKPTRYTIADLRIKIGFLTKMKEVEEAMLDILIYSTKPKGARNGNSKTHKN